MPQIRKCYICKKDTAIRQCGPECNMALYCEGCYLEYHQRGHRKLHTYKRIRYGTAPPDLTNKTPVETINFVKPGKNIKFDEKD